MLKEISDKIGTSNINKQGQYFEVIEYHNSRKCTVKFDDGTIKENVQFQYVKRGDIKNPNQKIFDRGYLGYENKNDYNSTSIFYRLWLNIFHRCYSKNYHQNKPTYIDCTVDENWFNFQNFAKWCLVNYQNNYVLDKDIIIKNNKIYGPNTCCFVPQELNQTFTTNKGNRGNLPIGICFSRNKYYVSVNKLNNKIYLGSFDNLDKAFEIYKLNKEKIINEIAELYKEKIPNIVYLAMKNYKIEITD